MAARRQIGVELEVDDKGTATVKRFTETASRGMKEVASSSRKAETAMQRVERAGGSLNTRLGGMRTIIAGLGFGLLARDFLSFANQVDRGRLMMQGFGNSAAGARVELEKVRTTDYSRAFGFEAALKGTARLTSVKDTVGDVDRAMRAFADGVSSFGGTGETLKLVTKAVQDMGSKGVISMEELRQQLGDSLPSAGKIMARELGMSYQDMVKVISAGNLDAQTGISALIRGLENDYGGATERMLTSMGGMGNQILTILRGVQQDVLDLGLMDSVKDELQSVIDTLEVLEADGSLEAWAQSAANVLGVLVETLGWGVRHADDLAIAIGALTVAWIAWNTAASYTPGVISRLFAAIAANPVGAFAVAVGALVAALSLANAAVESSAERWDRLNRQFDKAYSAYERIAGEVDRNMAAMSDLDQAIIDVNAGRRTEAEAIVELLRLHPSLKAAYDEQTGSLEAMKVKLAELTALRLKAEKDVLDQSRATADETIKVHEDSLRQIQLTVGKFGEAIAASAADQAMVWGPAREWLVGVEDRYKALLELEEKYLQKDGMEDKAVQVKVLRGELEKVVAIMAAQGKGGVGKMAQEMVAIIAKHRDELKALTDQVQKALTGQQKLSAQINADLANTSTAFAGMTTSQVTAQATIWRKQYKGLTAEINKWEAAGKKALQTTTSEHDKAAAKIQKIESKLTGDINKLTLSRTDYEITQAKKRAQAAVDAGAKEKLVNEWLALEIKRIKDEQAGREETQRAKRLQNEQAFLLEWAKATGDTVTENQILHNQFIDNWIKKGRTRDEAEALWAAKTVEVHKSALQRVTEAWELTAESMTELSVESFKSIQQGLKNDIVKIFKGEFESIGDVWESVLDNMINVFANFIAEIIARWVMSGVADLFSGNWTFTGSSQGQQSATGAASNALSAAGTAKSGWDLYNGLSGISSFGSYGGYGSSLFTWGESATAAGFVGPGAPTVTGLSTAGAASSALGGAVVGYGTSSLLYNGKGYSSIGGTLGGAGGGWAGATIGASVGGPVGAVVGFVLGSILGGAGGGGLGSLLGDDEDSDAEQALQYFAQNIEKITSGEDGGRAWLDAINQYEASQNKAREKYGELQEIYEELRKAGALEWWAPDYYTGKTLGHLDDEDYWKAVSALGNRDWGGSNVLGMGGLLGPEDLEGFEEFKEAISELDELLGPLSGGLRGIIDDLDLQNISAEELAATIEERLTPAWLIQNELNNNIADGVDNLTAHQKALDQTIYSLLSTTDLTAEAQDDLIDLLMRESGSVADLTAKYNRYNEIQSLLQNSYSMSRDEVEALVAEGRALHQELGLESNSMSGLTGATEKMTAAAIMMSAAMKGIDTDTAIKELDNLTDRLFGVTSGADDATAAVSATADAINNPTSDIDTAASALDNYGSSVEGVAASFTKLASGLELVGGLDSVPTEFRAQIEGISRHSGGSVPKLHTGSFVDMALANGLITAHGGARALMADEVPAVLQAGEWVIQKSAVDYYGDGFMSAINSRLLPVVDSSAAPQQAGPRVVLNFEGPLVVINGDGDPDDAEEIAETVWEIIQDKAESTFGGAF